MPEMLTPQQREAVFNRGGKLLVSAAAGSGKTKVLVDRLLSYLTDSVHPANLDEFLIITYTKAAASELRGKIASKLSERMAQEPGNRHLQKQMQRLYLTKISTVHAFCADILREYAYLLEIPADFRVADENECVEIQMRVLDSLLNRAYETAYEDPNFQAFINSQGFGRDDRQIPEILLAVYQSARCHLNPEKWLEWCLASADTDGVTDISQTVWGSYLIEDLKAYLRLQITTLSRCLEDAAGCGGMEKPVLLLQSTIVQLSTLLDANTWDEVIDKKDIDFGRLVFSKKCADPDLADRIKAIRNNCKTGLEKKLRSFATKSVQAIADLESSGTAAKGLISLVRQFSEEYDKQKRVRRILDFGDLEHKTLDLLVGRSRTAITALAKQLSKRYREIMVDEYQDSNAVQDAIFGALTNEKQNCFMVGDVKQSIYQFRLADPSIFIEKYNRYLPADLARPGEGRKVLLSSNFRSSNGIIRAVNDVFANCMIPSVGGLVYDENEMLREGIPHISIQEPEVELYGIDVQEDTYAEEASFVALKIKKLTDGSHLIRQGDTLRPIQPQDIVILLRSPGSVGGEFVYALDQQGICCTTGGSTDLLQTEEIMVLRSLLQVIDNPVQDIPLVSVLMSRIFRFSADDLAKIRGKSRRYSLYEMLCRQEDEKSVAFVELLKELRQDARLYTVPQLIQKIFLKTSIDSLYGVMRNGDERKKNLQMFSQIASDYDRLGQKDLSRFIEHLAAMEEKGLICTSDKDNTGNVTIMSVHKSKGLEFPVVFLCGLSRNFNQESTRAQVLCHKELGIGLSCIDRKNRVRYPTVAKKAIASKMMADSISEEMRVLYVAMTRARDRLYMTYAAKNISQDIADVALRLDMTEKELMVSDVSCPGAWVLQTAMRKIEAGEFFNIGGKPARTILSEPVWGIHFVNGFISESISSANEMLDEFDRTVVEKLRKSLSFQYPHQSATLAPSKVTATQMKGRFKDQEAAENTGNSKFMLQSFRKPGFIVNSVDGKETGNAIHAVMQFIRYCKCTSITGAETEIRRLIDNGVITEAQGKLIDPEKIAALFATPIGKKLCVESNVLREFKFSIMNDCGKYSNQLQNEQVLTQGVIDCAIVEPDGITVIDFKTDRISESDIPRIIARYAEQVHVYADAIARIYELPVKQKLLYLFEINRFVEVTNN